jgi:hypothetical protein
MIRFAVLALFLLTGCAAPRYGCQWFDTVSPSGTAEKLLVCIPLNQLDRGHQ